MIAVTGATGEVGGRVARGLAARGAQQRLIVRDVTRAPPLDGASAVAVPGGYADGAALRSALDGVDTLLLVPAHESATRVDEHRAAVDAAVAAGVGRIVYLSFLGAAPDATFTLARDHWHTEEHIRTAGVPWTFARMNLYMDFIPGMAQEDVIRGPAGDGRVSAIPRDDVAAACVALLLDDAHAGATVELTGREAFSFAEAAAALSRALGREVRYVDETDEEAYASRASYGAPDWEVAGWVSSYQAVRDGSVAKVTGDAERLTGRPPRTLAEFLAQPGG